MNEFIKIDCFRSLHASTGPHARNGSKTSRYYDWYFENVIRFLESNLITWWNLFLSIICIKKSSTGHHIILLIVHEVEKNQ